MIKSENNSIEEYLTIVECSDSSPTITTPVENTVYCNHLYLYGIESFVSELRTMEYSVLREARSRVSTIKKKTYVSPADVSPFKELTNRLNYVVQDSVRERLLDEWLTGSIAREIDTSFPYSVQTEIENERRANFFFWGCISAQIESANRVFTEIAEYTADLENILSHQTTRPDSSELSFRVTGEVPKGVYLDITTTLHAELMREGWLKRGSSLAGFRSLFTHSDINVDHERLATTIVWQNTSWRTVSYFVRGLQQWLIVTPPQGSKKSNYKVASTRIVNSDNELFKVKKFRHDADPNQMDKNSLDQVFADVIQKHRMELNGLVSASFLRELRLTMDMRQ